MSLDSLEQEVADVVRAHEGKDFYSIIPHTLFQRLRGMVIAVCGEQVVIAVTIAEAEGRAKDAGWQYVRIFSGPPQHPMTLAELEGVA